MVKHRQVCLPADRNYPAYCYLRSFRLYFPALVGSSRPYPVLLGSPELLLPDLQVKTIKKGRMSGLFLLPCCVLLAGSDSSGRASVCAGSAIDADCRVDAVDITFFDSAGRALTLAGSASDASVGRDFVGHNVCCLRISLVQM